MQERTNGFCWSSTYNDLGNEALPHNRRVDIEVGLLNRTIIVMHSNTPPPAILHVNQESRNETLPNYQVMLRGNNNNGGITYVDFDNDTVSFYGEEFNPIEYGMFYNGWSDHTGGPVAPVSINLRQQLLKIQRMEVMEMWWSEDCTEELDPDNHYPQEQERLFFGHMPRLTEITLVARIGEVGCGALCNRTYRDECEGVIRRFFLDKQSTYGHIVPILDIVIPTSAEPGPEDPDYNHGVWYQRWR